MLAVLVPEPQLLDDFAVSVDVRPLHVIEQTAASADHLQQAASAMMVLLVRPKVLGQVVNSLGQERDLDACGAGIRLVRLVLLERRCVVESHVDELSPPGGGLSVAKVIEHGKLAHLQAHVKGYACAKTRLSKALRSLNVESTKIIRISTSPTRRMYSRVRMLNGAPFAASATLSRI